MYTTARGVLATRFGACSESAHPLSFCHLEFHIVDAQKGVGNPLLSRNDVIGMYGSRESISAPSLTTNAESAHGVTRPCVLFFSSHDSCQPEL